MTEVSSVARAGPGFYSVPSGQQAACLKQHHFQPGSVSEDGLWGEALERGPPEACGPASGSPRLGDMAWRGLPASRPRARGITEPGGGDQASETNTNRHGALPSEAPTPISSLPHPGAGRAGQEGGVLPWTPPGLLPPFTHPGAGGSHPGPVEKEGFHEGPLILLDLCPLVKPEKGLGA